MYLSKLKRMAPGDSHPGAGVRHIFGRPTSHLIRTVARNRRAAAATGLGLIDAPDTATGVAAAGTGYWLPDAFNDAAPAWTG